MVALRVAFVTRLRIYASDITGTPRPSACLPVLSDASTSRLRSEARRYRASCVVGGVACYCAPSRSFDSWSQLLPRKANLTAGGPDT